MHDSVSVYLCPMRRLVGLCVLIGLAACRPANDGVLPEWYLLTPAEGQAVTDGDTLFYEGTLVDNEELTQVAISVSPHFDSLTPLAQILPPYQWDSTWPVEGNTYFLAMESILGDSAAAGDYKLRVSATDEAGNVASLVRHLRWSSKYDALAPAIDSATVPDSVLQGEPLSLYFEWSDTVALSYAILRVERLATAAIVADSVVALGGAQQSVALELPFNGPVGSYRLRLIVADWANNRKSQTFNLLVYL